MAEDKKDTDDSDDSKKLILKLDEDDSALIVRTDGSIELISRELQGKDENYVGDIEDLNRTFTLVLAFAAAIENERLYNDIFQNLNHVLQRQWSRFEPWESLGGQRPFYAATPTRSSDVFRAHFRRSDSRAITRVP